MKEMIIELSNGIKISALLTHKELIYGVTGVAIGLRNNYLEISGKEGKLDNIFAKHPITNEKLPIIVVNDKKLESKSVLLIPAHIQKHFEMARKYDLEYKQVVAPYFKGEKEEAINPKAETQLRTSVIAVIKNEKDNTYLCVEAKKRICRSFVLGGIEDGETPEEAAIREVKEETGYNDILIDRRSIFQLHNHFYAAYKGVNRYATLYVVFGRLNSKDKETICDEEKEKQQAVWIKKEELKNFLTVNNNLFVNEYLLDDDCAYEGDGIMINSKEFNGKLRSEVKK